MKTYDLKDRGTVRVENGSILRTFPKFFGDGTRSVVRVPVNQITLVVCDGKRNVSIITAGSLGPMRFQLKTKEAQELADEIEAARLDKDA